MSVTCPGCGQQFEIVVNPITQAWKSHAVMSFLEHHREKGWTVYEIGERLNMKIDIVRYALRIGIEAGIIKAVGDHRGGRGKVAKFQLRMPEDKGCQRESLKPRPSSKRTRGVRPVRTGSCRTTPRGRSPVSARYARARCSRSRGPRSRKNWR